MKNFMLMGCCFFYSITLCSQNPDLNIRKAKIGISGSGFGSSMLQRFQELVGESRTDCRRSVTLGFDYLYPLNKVLDIETGLEFTSISTSNHPMVIPTTDLGGNNITYYRKLNIVDIPLSIRLNCPYYFFVNGGLLLDMDISKSSDVDPQTGIGTMFGFGWKYDFKSGWEIAFNPYLKLHSLFSIYSSNNPQHLLESGLKLGVMFPLK